MLAAAILTTLNILFNFGMMVLGTIAAQENALQQGRPGAGPAGDLFPPLIGGFIVFACLLAPLFIAARNMLTLSSLRGLNAAGVSNVFMAEFLAAGLVANLALLDRGAAIVMVLPTMLLNLVSTALNLAAVALAIRLQLNDDVAQALAPVEISDDESSPSIPSIRKVAIDVEKRARRASVIAGGTM
jgi:hypothetical protein